MAGTGSQVRRCRFCSQLQAPCLSHFCSLCHCFPSCLACSEHRTFWGMLASVPLGQGSDPSWTPSMLRTMGAPQGEQASCTHTAPPCTYPGMALQIALPCNQHHRPAFLHAQLPLPYLHVWHHLYFSFILIISITSPIHGMTEILPE